MSPRLSLKCTINTYDDTVGAGHGAAAALRAGPDTDDGDRAASQTQEDVGVDQVDADGLKNGGTSGGVSLLNTV